MRELKQKFKHPIESKNPILSNLCEKLIKMKLNYFETVINNYFIINFLLSKNLSNELTEIFSKKYQINFTIKTKKNLFDRFMTLNLNI